MLIFLNQTEKILRYPFVFSGDYGVPYVSNAFGSATSGGGIINSSGSCLYFCTTLSTANFAPYISATSTPGALSDSTLGDVNYIAGALVAYDGNAKYIFLRERSGATFRSYIFKIDSGGNYTQIAGDLNSVMNSTTPHVAAGTTVAGNTGGNTTLFAANGVLYEGVGTTSLLTGTATWVTQISAGANITGLVLDKRGSTDPLQTVIYYTKGDKKLYYKYYTALGGGASIEAADFTGVLSTNAKVVEIDPTNSKTLYIIDGNSIYKYYSASLP